jgi:hypothetical protein
MRNTILIAVISLLIIGCSKDKFTTKPQLKFKSVNTNVLDVDQIIRFTLSFTDAEGDVDSIFIRKITPNCASTIFKDDRSLPIDFKVTNGKEADFIVSYGHRVQNFPAVGDPLCNFNDTCTFRFVIMDKAKNLSDTVYSETVVIIKQ